jgi:transcriptional regulator with XRE-family HTH domain
MRIGFHDSIRANGDAIRKDREIKNISREALVALSMNAFSLKTLARAEDGEIISKEKLGHIASALGRPHTYYFLSEARKQTSGDSAVTIHHWDDQIDNITFVPQMLADSIMRKYDKMIDCVEDVYSQNTRKYMLKTHDIFGFDIKYQVYGDLYRFHDIIATEVGKNDIIIIDAMNETGEYRIVSDWISALGSVERIINKHRVIIFTAYTQIVKRYNVQLDGIMVIKKMMPFRLYECLIELILAIGDMGSDV